MQDRYSGIDFLRFLAAYTVAVTHLIINHYQTSLKLEIISSMAVEVFFIISGFVLAPQIIKLVSEKKFVNYRIFLMRRWYRTIPLYVLSLVITSIILNKYFSIDFIKYLFFFQNFFFIWVDEDYFSISWSLSVEEWFYVIFPIFLILISKILNFKKKNSLFIAIIFVVLIFLIRFIFTNFDDWGSSVRRIVFFRLDAIAFGFILYYFKDILRKNILNLILISFSIILTTYITYKIFEININENYLFIKMFSHFMIAIWGSIILIFFYLINKLINKNFVFKLNIFLGRISYSTYLFHLILIYVIGSFKDISLTLFLIIFTVAQIIISSVLYYFFEEPILKSRPSYKYEN